MIYYNYCITHTDTHIYTQTYTFTHALVFVSATDVNFAMNPGKEERAVDRGVFPQFQWISRWASHENDHYPLVN